MLCILALMVTGHLYRGTHTHHIRVCEQCTSCIINDEMNTSLSFSAAPMCLAPARPRVTLSSSLKPARRSSRTKTRPCSGPGESCLRYWPHTSTDLSSIRSVCYTAPGNCPIVNSTRGLKSVYFYIYSCPLNPVFLLHGPSQFPFWPTRTSESSLLRQLLMITMATVTHLYPRSSLQTRMAGWTRTMQDR